MKYIKIQHLIKKLSLKIVNLNLLEKGDFLIQSVFFIYNIYMGFKAHLINLITN